MAREIGVRNLHYATLLTDTPGGTPTFGPVTRIPKLINFGTASNFSEYQFYSDDVVEEAGDKIQTETISIELGHITKQLKAAITGNTFDATLGVYTTNVSAAQPALALLYEISLSDGSVDYRVLYNCKLKITEITNSTQADSIESANVIIEGHAIPLASLHIMDMQISGTDNAAAADKIANFFTAVQLPIAD